jgi:hypothetical protein
MGTSTRRWSEIPIEIDGLPMKNGDLPWQTVSHNQMRTWLRRNPGNWRGIWRPSWGPPLRCHAEASAPWVRTIAPLGNAGDPLEFSGENLKLHFFANLMVQPKKYLYWQLTNIYIFILTWKSMVVKIGWSFDQYSCWMMMDINKCLVLHLTERRWVHPSERT